MDAMPRTANVRALKTLTLFFLSPADCLLKAQINVEEIDQLVF